MKKILIVDNSNLIVNVLEELFLVKNNFEIYKAKSLAEVEDLIFSNSFFLAISNLVLPDALNGELLELKHTKRQKYSKNVNRNSTNN